MAHAICTKCGGEAWWRAQRGARLADLKSGCCGAPLKGLGAGKESMAKGKKYEICIVCGKKGLPKKLSKYQWGGIIHPNINFEVAFPISKQKIVYSKGSPAHSWHDFVPVGRTWATFSVLDGGDDERESFRKQIMESPLDEKGVE